MKQIKIRFTVFCMIMLFFLSCDRKGSERTPEPAKEEAAKTASASNKVADVLRLEGGDWGYPTPFAHYPRGPGGFKMCLIFDSLLERDEKGMIPWLAEKWEILEDGRQYRFTIRNNVFWHDGEPLTAEDVAFSLNYASRHALAWSFIFGKIENAAATGDREVLVTVSDPSVVMLDNIGRTRIFPKHIWSLVENPKTFHAPEAVIGSGPYRLTDYSKNHGTYRFEASDNFWGPAPAAKAIEYIPVSQPILAFEQREIDAAIVPPDTLPRFQKDPQYRIVKGPAFWGYRLLFNLEREPVLKKKEMRQAIRYAVNSTDLVAKTARGAGIPGSAGILPPDHVLYNPSVKTYPHNPEKAVELAAACGYTRFNADGIRMNEHGDLLSFTLLCSSGARMTRSPISEIRIAEMIKEFLAQIGIGVQVVSVDEKRRDAAIIDNDYELLIVGHGGWGMDPQILKKRFTESDPAGRSLAEYPSYGFAHTDLSDLLKEQDRTFDPEQRKALVWKIQDLIAEELPELVLFNTTQYTVYRPEKYNGWRIMFDHHAITHGKLSFLKKGAGISAL